MLLFSTGSLGVVVCKEVSGSVVACWVCRSHSHLGFQFDSFFFFGFVRPLHFFCWWHFLSHFWHVSGFLRFFVPWQLSQMLGAWAADVVAGLDWVAVIASVLWLLQRHTTSDLFVFQWISLHCWILWHASLQPHSAQSMGLLLSLNSAWHLLHLRPLYFSFL